jgi:hypothetical protein
MREMNPSRTMVATTRIELDVTRMAEAHGTHDDPNAPPMHHEIVDTFTRAQIAFCAALGGVAIVAGLILGIILVND